MPQPHSSHRQYLIAWTFIIFLLLAGIAVLVNLQRNQNLQRRAALPPATTALQLSSTQNLQNLTAGQTFTVNAHAMRADQVNQPQAIYGADLQLQFDATRFTVESIQLGSGLPNGCTSTAVSMSAVLAPIMSETNCTFNFSSVKTVAEQGGMNAILEFGIAAFNWAASSQPTYQPLPINVPVSPNQLELAKITFKVKTGAPAGSSTIKIRTANNSGAMCPAGQPNCGTTDTNLAALSTTNEVGDILNTVIPTTGLAVTVTGGGSCTPTNGDTDNNGQVDLADFVNFRLDFLQPTVTHNADFNCSGLVDLADFVIFRTNFLQ